MIQQFTTKSGSEYMVVPFTPGTSTLLQRESKEFNMVGRIDSPTQLVQTGKPFTGRFTSDKENGNKAGQTLRTTAVTYSKIVDNTADYVDSQENIDKDISAPEWLVDAQEIYTKNTKYRLEATKDPLKKLIYGGSFADGQEVEISGTIEVGQPLTMTVTSSKQIIQTSEIQGIRPVIVDKQSHRVLGADEFTEAINNLQNVKQNDITM